MATVTGLTADAMNEIADASVVSGTVNAGTGHLLLTTRGAATIDAGNVKGATGTTGSTGPAGTNGTNGTNGTTEPTGAVVMFAAAAAPSGWHICDGSAISRSTFSALFAVIGTTFGTGDGSTTFNVPNMQSRSPRQDTAALAGIGGAATHSHQIDGGTTAAVAQITGGTSMFEKSIATASWTSNDGASGFSGSPAATAKSLGAAVVGVTQTAPTLPPYLNLNFIIKT